MAAAADIPRSRSRTLTWAWLAVAVLAGASYLTTSSLPVRGVSYFGIGAGSLALGAFTLRRRHGRVPLPWVLILTSAATWLAGDALWAGLNLNHDLSFPSPTAAVFFAGYPLMFAGVLAAWRARMLHPLGGLLDTSIVAVAGGLFVWATVVTAPGTPGSPLATAFALAYPTFDLALLAAVAQLLVAPPHGGRRSLYALAAALALTFAAHVAYASEGLRGTYHPAGVTDLGWYGCYLLIGLAALQPDARWVKQAPVRAVELTWRRLAALGATCLLVPAAAAIQIERGALDPYAFVAGGSLLMTLVFLRMALLFREQQRAQEEVRASGDLYRALVEQNGDLVSLSDASGRFVYASAAHLPTLGYTPEELLALGPADLVHPHDRPLADSSLAALASGSPAGAARVRLRHRNGSWIWADVRGTAIRGPDGAPLILFSSRDVTRRHEAEQELERTTHVLQTLVDTAPVAIVGADLDGRVTLWNPRAEELFGWVAEEVLGELTPLLDGESLAATMAALRAGRTLESEQTRPRKDGSTVDVLASAVAFHSDAGAVVGVLAIFLDVSERTRLEEQLRQAQRLEAIGQLAGGVAHDFNNLLTAISGYQELALRRVAGDETLERQLSGIGRAADRAAGLTRQLLAFSRRQLLQPSVFDLNDAVEQTNSLLRRVLGAHIGVVTSLDARGCHVRADQSQVEQVLMNLAVNARDAMPDGGTLTIETTAATLEGGDHVRLRVSDTGSGMDEQTRARAFEPFFTTKEQGKGTGLGLATVYGIVSQSGGSVTVRSAPGEGACFEVLLPWSAETPESQEGREPEAEPGSERVLLVEDEPIVRELTREMLEEHGYAVVAASRPEEALELARREQVDLLVTDVVMPGMNGRALAAELRSDRPDLRVLYTSGYSDDAALQGGTLEPLASFLQKPYSAGELGEAVRRTLDAAA